MELHNVFAGDLAKIFAIEFYMVISELNKSRLLVAILVLILGVGAFLRLYRISEYMTFLGDEGRDMLVVKRMIVDHKFTLLGPTASVGGFFMGPIYYYFMTPFLWAWQLDPVGPAIMVALFGIATIYLVYLCGKQFFGIREGLMAAGLYAISPQIINYSRSSWNPNIVPFFALGIIYLLWKIAVGSSWVILFWVGLLFGIGVQLHYTFLFLGAVIVVYLFIYSREGLHWSDVLRGIGGFIIGWGPFLAFELRHGFPNTISIYRFLVSGKDTGFSIMYFMNTIIDVTLRLYGRLLLRLPNPYVMNEQIITGFFIVSVFVVIIAALMAVWKGKTTLSHVVYEQRALILCGIWFSVITGLFGLYRKGIYDYYFGIYYALPFLTTAYVLGKLSRVRYGAVAAGGIIIVVGGYLLQGMPIINAPNNQLGQTKMVASQILEKTQGEPFNFALVTGGNSDHAYRYFMEIWGKAPVVIEPEMIDPLRRSVTKQLIVLCEDKACKPLGHSLWEIAGFGRAQIDGEWDVSFMKIYRLTPYEES